MGLRLKATSANSPARGVASAVISACLAATLEKLVSCTVKGVVQSCLDLRSANVSCCCCCIAACLHSGCVPRRWSRPKLQRVQTQAVLLLSPPFLLSTTISHCRSLSLRPKPTTPTHTMVVRKGGAAGGARRMKKDTSEVVDLVKSVRKHKKFKQLASYSVQCLQKVRMLSHRDRVCQAANIHFTLAGAHSS